MSDNPEAAATCQGQEPMNWNLCMLCQYDDDKEKLVQHPRIDSYKRVVERVEERASLHDANYVEVHRRLNSWKDTLCTHEAVYHRSCYSNATNSDQIQRARDRYAHALATGRHTPKKRGIKRGSKEMEESGPSTSVSSSPFTRSRTCPLDKEICFFCQKHDDAKLYNLRTVNAGNSLREAVERSNNVILQTRLNTCIAPGDGHSIDVQYHKKCWTEHVFHGQREGSTIARTTNRKEPLLQRASLLELINLVDIQTQNRGYLPMVDIETTYVNMLGAEAMENHVPTFNRKWLKDMILNALPHLKSCLQKNRRKSAVLYSPNACQDSMVNSAMESHCVVADNMQTIYKAAQVIRKSIAIFTKAVTDPTTIQVTSDIHDVPAELYTAIRWIMIGPVDCLETERRTKVVDRAALTMSQNIMYGFKSDRQVNYKPTRESAVFRPPQTRENPQVLGLALTVHHKTRNKMLINLLSAHDYCVPYSRTLRMETALANAVVQNTRELEGLYVPPFLKKGAFVFFAVDNTDFAEDTPDGKGTTHGTITAVYQKADVRGAPVAPPLKITEAHTLSVSPYHVHMMQCDKPKPQHAKRTENFVTSNEISCSYQLSQLGWIVATALSRFERGEAASNIPGWAGYNSLLSESKPLTHVGALPLLPEVAHEWSTLLTVIMQASELRKLTVGEDHPTVISFDMALYEKVVQMLDANPILKRTVFPRLGELHAVMAALRALGSSMENSGIDDAWIEADVYGSATTRQILKCTHYKRALRAHTYSYVALYEMLLEEFFNDTPQLKQVCLMATEGVEAACSEGNKHTRSESVKQAHTTLLEALTAADVSTLFQKWGKQRSKNAMFKAMMNYLQRVETILLFVAATRNADLELHLQAGEQLSKLFFAFDRIKYKRLWPRYITDMHDLKNNHPKTWEEMKGGNIAVTRNAIPFVSIGADHACEHLNKLMKIHSGIVGISNNANARQRFFMVIPELSRVAKDFYSQFDLEHDITREHHDLGPSAVKKQHHVIDKIKEAILKHGNPFAAVGAKLENMITHAYIPDEYVQRILNADETGQKLYEDYVSERINGDVSLWAPVKKEKNNMFMSANHTTTVKLRDKTVDLKETKDLYGRLMVLARSNRDINQKEAIGNYEFTLTPRALFAPDGTILPCLDKSKLINLLNTLPTAETVQEDPRPEGGMHTTPEAPSHKIALVDGMVILQKMAKKPATIVTVKDLSDCFNERLMSLTREYDEIILVFDTYREESLKGATRDKRRHGKAPIQYQVRDDTNIKHIPMNRFLSHDKTKADLTNYLAAKTLEYNNSSPKLVITCSSGHTRSNKDLVFDYNNHEEADTLLIYQAVLASKRNSPDAKIVFFSPDTDVLVLVIANYDLMLKNTWISMVSGVMEIEPIRRVLGSERAKALPAFHAFTGADNTGRFSRIGKATWLEAYMKATPDVINCLQMLSTEAEVSETMLSTLASFVCVAYSPKDIYIKNICELRWHLFCKHMAESDKLPPTLAALKQHVLRVHIQARVWGQANIALQGPQLDPLQNGYHKESDGQLKPTMTDALPAPKALIEMVSCQCKRDCSSARCSCRKNYLSCTDLCQCSSECKNDEDTQTQYETDDDDAGDDIE